ncbi:MAG: sialidase family protein [Planctomycetota bacterium]
MLDSTSGKTGVDEPALAEVAPGKLVVISRPEGDIFLSDDMGATWTAPVTFGMRMYAPKLLALRDGTLLCLFGSYCKGHGGFRAIWSTDHGKSWIAPAEDHGFIIDDSVYGYGAGVELADGSVWCVYYDPGTDKQRKTGIRSIRIRVNAEKDGLEILPASGVQADGGDSQRKRLQGTLDADAM